MAQDQIYYLDDENGIKLLPIAIALDRDQEIYLIQIFEENYEFEPDAPGSKRYKSKNNKFEDDFFGGTNLFFINTKGMKLDDYKFSIYMEDLQPTTTSGGSVEVYGNYDLENNKIVTVSSTSSSIVFGIIKIRETNNFDDERTRDMKFIITPIENWRD